MDILMARATKQQAIGCSPAPSLTPVRHMVVLLNAAAAVVPLSHGGPHRLDRHGQHDD